MEVSHMHILSIHGGSRLTGTVQVPGSKNAALGLLSAVVLARGVTVFENAPDIVDVRLKARLLESFGAKTSWQNGTLTVDTTEVIANRIEEEVARSIRTSFFLLGPLLARLGKISLPAPGGCKIGARPVDFHIKGLTALGAQIEYANGFYHASADRLVGTDIYLDNPSPGATQHLMATAALASGVTTIHNAAMEPEVLSMADFINQMGGRIEGAGGATITIIGVDALGGTRFRIPSDRIQAGTYLVGGAITGGDVTVEGILPETQTPIVGKLREAGANVEVGHDSVRVQADGRLKAVNIRTMPYPGFPTDMQQPACALLSVCEGTSLVEETIYEGRIGHIQELNRMGAQIALRDRTSIISGVARLQGANVEASDLRAGAALVLAGLVAEGETVIRNVHYIDRGYENIEATITALGGTIKRLTVEDPSPTLVH
jgi:UDP-N-acetylglucosamine 1-carboxyvinyltransferase